MKYLFFCCLLLVSGRVFSQEENEHWEAYMAQYDAGAGSTVVNMTLKQSAPVSSYRYLLITGVKFKNCSEGFPVEGEFEKLYRISDSVKAIVNSSVRNVMAGSFTYQCERLDYYYLSDTANIRKKLTALYKRKFPAYTPVIKIREDQSWKAYHSFLYPNEETMEYIENSKVVMKLHEAGDKLDKERVVDHFLYFRTEKDRDHFITYAQANQFKVASKEILKEGSYPFQLHLTRADKVDLPSICKLTLQLKKEALKHNGMYDGWETMVVK